MIKNKNNFFYFFPEVKIGIFLTKKVQKGAERFYRSTF